MSGEPCERGKTDPRPGYGMCGKPSEHVVLNDIDPTWRLPLCDDCFLWAMDQGFITQPYIGIGE